MPKFTRVELQPGSERLHWMKWKVSDHIAQTRYLSLVERGALVELMAHSWLNGPLPSNAKRLATMLGISLEEFEAIWPEIENLWVETPAGWIRPELEIERQSAMRVYRAKAASGRKTARIRKGKSAARQLGEENGAERNGHRGRDRDADLDVDREGLRQGERDHDRDDHHGDARDGERDADRGGDCVDDRWDGRDPHPDDVEDKT